MEARPSAAAPLAVWSATKAGSNVSLPPGVLPEPQRRKGRGAAAGSVGRLLKRRLAPKVMLPKRGRTRVLVALPPPPRQAPSRVRLVATVPLPAAPTTRSASSVCPAKAALTVVLAAVLNQRPRVAPGAALLGGAWAKRMMPGRL